MRHPEDSLHSGSSYSLSRQQAQPKADYLEAADESIAPGNKVLYYLPSPDLSRIKPTPQQRRDTIDIIDDVIALIDDIGLIENLIEIDLIEAFKNAPALPLNHVFKRKTKAFSGDFTSEAEKVEDDADYVIDMSGSASDNLQDLEENVSISTFSDDDMEGFAANLDLIDKINKSLEDESEDLSLNDDTDVNDNNDINSKLAESMEYMNEIIEDAIDRSDDLEYDGDKETEYDEEQNEDPGWYTTEYEDIEVSALTEEEDQNEYIPLNLEENNNNLKNKNEASVYEESENQNDLQTTLEDQDEFIHNDIFESKKVKPEVEDDIVNVQEDTEADQATAETGDTEDDEENDDDDVNYKDKEEVFNEENNDDDDDKVLDEENDDDNDKVLDEEEEEEFLGQQIDIIVDFLEPVIKNELSVHEVSNVFLLILFSYMAYIINYV